MFPKHQNNVKEFGQIKEKGSIALKEILRSL